jgi:hypothetical protein
VISALNPQLSFETDFFQPLPGEEEKTNPGCYGQALALWLRDQLVSRGVSVEEVLPEDFGWVVLVARHPFLRWLGCGNTDGSTTEWIIFPQAERSLRQRIFGGPDPSVAVQELWSHLQVLVPTIPGLLAVTWQ